MDGINNTNNANSLKGVENNKTEKNKPVNEKQSELKTGDLYMQMAYLGNINRANIETQKNTSSKGSTDSNKEFKTLIDEKIEEKLEEDVAFNAKDLAESTISNAEDITDVIKTLEKRKAHHISLSNDTIVELSNEASALNKEYESNINEAQKQISDIFDDLLSVNEVTGRAKSEDSTFEKLASKYENGKLTSTSNDACLDAIGDAYGTRVQIKSLLPEQSKSIIEDTLTDTGISYEQFVNYLDGGKTGLDDASVETIEELSKTVLNNLKEAQTNEVFEKLLNSIDDGSITITELNNYGDDISSYFTPNQIKKLADTYYKKTGKALNIVTKMDESYFGSGSKVSVDDEGNTTVKNKDFVIKEKGASKDSGYTSSQMNVKHTLSNDTTGNGELQIRGTVVNEFADVEHIPYDIRKDKIIESDTEYAPVFNIISKMKDTTYNSYNTYLTKVYNWKRLEELGIKTSEPDINLIMKDSGLTQDALNLLKEEGLIKFSKNLKH